MFIKIFLNIVPSNTAPWTSIITRVLCTSRPCVTGLCWQDQRLDTWTVCDRFVLAGPASGPHGPCVTGLCWQDQRLDHMDRFFGCVASLMSHQLRACVGAAFDGLLALLEAYGDGNRYEGEYTLACRLALPSQPQLVTLDMVRQGQAQA